MKRNLLRSLSVLPLFFSAVMTAQTVPNNSFENWTTAPTFQHPVVLPCPLFHSSNFDDFYRTGILTVTQVPGVSGSAMRVENILGPMGDTLNGYASWGDVQGSTMTGGAPLPSGAMLTGANVSVRYALNASTPGFIAFIPYSGGVPCGAGNGLFPGAYVYQMTGSQPAFANMNFTFSPALTTAPDSCVIFVTSSDQVVTQKGTPGDFIEVDNFSWTGSPDVFPGGNLDVWQNVPAVEVPQIWNVDMNNSGGNSFAKSSTASAGMYSLQLMNVDDGHGYIHTGRAMLGYWVCPSGPGPCVMHSGMALASTPKAFGFYYKYSTPGVDTASAYTNLTAAGMGVAGGSTYLFPAATWTFMSMNIPTPGSTPDSAFISFESGRYPGAIAGSTLLIDDMKFHYCNEIANINGPTSVCVNSSGVVFSINSEFASGYSWSTTTGVISGSSTGQTVTIDNILSGGTVSVTKMYGDGCPNKTFNLSISTSASASANAGSSQNICSNQPVMLTGSVTGATGGNWMTSGTGTFANPTSLSTTYNPTAADIAASPITLTLMPTGTGACPSSNGNMTVTFKPIPTVGAGTDMTVCYGTNVTLYGSGAVSYTWDNGATDGVSFAPPVGTTVYTVTGTAANSCTNTDMISIMVNPLPSVTFTLSAAVDTVCDNASAFALTGGSPAGGNYAGTGVTAGMFNPVTAGVGSHIITYSYTDVNSCQAMGMATIVVKNCTTTGIDESSLVSRIYPNPATTELYIELNNSGKGYAVSISDVSGRVISTGASDKDVFKVNTEALAKGVYFVKITLDGQVINRRIVKE
ncbi:MAG: T9SS type A sorting domain-containing protein [Bacteroidia bacterium]